MKKFKLIILTIITVTLSYYSAFAGSFTYANQNNLVGMHIYENDVEIVLAVEMNNGTFSKWNYVATKNDLAEIAMLKSIQAQLLYAKTNGCSLINFEYTTWLSITGVEVQF